MATTKVPRDTAALIADQVCAAGEYIMTHAADFAPRAGSDEFTLADGLVITIRVAPSNSFATITLEREMLLMRPNARVI